MDYEWRLLERDHKWIFDDSLGVGFPLLFVYICIDIKVNPSTEKGWLPFNSLVFL